MRTLENATPLLSFPRDRAMLKFDFIYILLLLLLLLLLFIIIYFFNLISYKMESIKINIYLFNK